jgi:hypothetical protein
MHNEVSETLRRRRRTNDLMKDIDQLATYVVRKPRRKRKGLKEVSSDTYHTPTLLAYFGCVKVGPRFFGS